MWIWDSLVINPLSLILNTANNWTHDYGATIVVFTLIVRGILFPLAIKQQKSMKEMQKIQPLLAAIQAKYKNDKEKLSQETMKLYQEHKVNPAGGCLPMLVQLPILIGLYQVILKYPDIMNFPLFGTTFMNLKEIPNFNQPSILWLLPILAGATTYISSKMMTAANATSNQNEQAAQMTKSMNNIFPIMTAFISFSVPAGLGFYWVVSNLLMILQQYLLNKFFHFNPKEGLIK
ncbi:MAG: membrane protein insertase YidC [Hyphomonadaceae bacterium]|nr:membrane protein insertase YidC [Clostridia bacterium]